MSPTVYQTSLYYINKLVLCQDIFKFIFDKLVILNTYTSCYLYMCSGGGVAHCIKQPQNNHQTTKNNQKQP